ncbi:unnamed protein product [Clonostachys solani]|uniref:RRM domain-containing protein n=1 Tax=Clonostachys solani TaxID=160281 RepID=A0A9N9W210_9HYPO|nr:unnamed protein product [Clonostachys solani]
MVKPANDLQTFVNNARERNKNEALASKIFDKNRRKSAPTRLNAQSGSGSLASRISVNKRASLGGKNAVPRPKGDVNGEWTHDLHSTVNPPKKSTSLSSRISKPGSKTAPQAASKKTTARRAAALDRMDVDVNVQKQVNIRSQGISIRGIAGPFTVVGQNFAPGTTAADIESVLTPFGGHMESCKIVKTKPFVVAEMVFASKEGGDRVIETFNNKTADGRLLKVYPKIGGNKPASNQADTNGQVVDGSLGFSESSQPLYSDRLLNGNEGRSQRNRGRR